MRLHSESGATMLEYVLMISLIALVVVAAAQLFGDSVLGLFDGAGASL